MCSIFNFKTREWIQNLEKTKYKLFGQKTHKTEIWEIFFTKYLQKEFAFREIVSVWIFTITATLGTNKLF